MKSRLVVGTVAGGLVLVLLSAVWLLRGDAETIDRFETVARPAKIHPDYADTVIPPNICPMNFVVDEPGEKYCVRITSKQGRPVEVFSRSPGIVIPVKPWRELLGQNRGEKLSIEVYVKGTGGVWRRFAPVENTVAAEPIDAYLVYREMPVYSLIWSNMGIYQRDLEGCDETVILHNRSFGHGCCNCHSFLVNSPAHLAVNVRKGRTGKPPGGLLIAEDGAVTAVVDTTTAFNRIPAIYLAWHPSGKAIGFSTNRIHQTFHLWGENRRATDSLSDMGVYLVESNVVTTSPDIARPDRLETSPAWSADGRWLYFCSAPTLPIERYLEFRYDLMRVGYDIDANTWGKPETVLSSTETGLSISQPRVSPDGRWLVFCMAEAGGFPVFDRSSDLYIMDLTTRAYRRLEVNSEQAESWHAWSSNGRWVVFSSKRPDGLLARPYFAYVDPEGNARKPFLLPQRDPAFYDACVRVYNCPELVTGPVPLSRRRLLRGLYAPAKARRATLDPALAWPEGKTGATTTSVPRTR